ncbi:hypothetical protein, partial [Bacteroides cellulosilyticus]|uniref:hypothetical protein n=1 Tax=Bacteroides cellulosilyticus TaxID=246787 RepID=UPI0032C167F4
LTKIRIYHQEYQQSIIKIIPTCQRTKVLLPAMPNEGIIISSGIRSSEFAIRLCLVLGFVIR